MKRSATLSMLILCFAFVLQAQYPKHGWPQFYPLRDGIKKYSLEEIGHERRMGYGWYTDAPPREVLDRYQEWKNQMTINQ